jgi:hypothetical protein
MIAPRKLLRGIYSYAFDISFTLLCYCIYIRNIMTLAMHILANLGTSVKACVQHMYGKLLFDEQSLTLYLFLICMYCIVYSSLAFHLFVYCDSLINRLNRANNHQPRSTSNVRGQQ